jgi:hypothetical protein
METLSVDLCIDENSECRMRFKVKYNKVNKNQYQIDFGETLTFEVNRCGSLSLKVTLPKLSNNHRWVSYVGLALIKSVVIEVNGDIISERNGEYYYISNELKMKEDEKVSYDKMIGKDLKWGSEETVLNIPLKSWTDLCPITGYFVEKHVTIEFEKLSKLIQIRSVSMSKDIPDIHIRDIKFIMKDGLPNDKIDNIIENVKLDTFKIDMTGHPKYCQKMTTTMKELYNTGESILNYDITGIIHKYLKEEYNTEFRFNLNLNNGCKETIWVVDRLPNYPLVSKSIIEDNIEAPNPFGHVDILKRCKFRTNGLILFEHPGHYYTMVQPFHFYKQTVDNVYYRSYCGDPKDYSSGVMNFRRLNHTEMIVNVTEEFEDGMAELRLYSVNYNIFDSEKCRMKFI